MFRHFLQNGGKTSCRLKRPSLRMNILCAQILTIVIFFFGQDFSYITLPNPRSSITTAAHSTGAWGATHDLKDEGENYYYTRVYMEKN